MSRAGGEGCGRPGQAGAGVGSGYDDSIVPIVIIT